MPDDYTLVAVETASIQSYIFASNRLKENVGASYLVAAATNQWAEDIARDVTGQANLSLPIDKHPVEKIYSGGGNFVVLFRRHTDAKDFVRRLSRKVLTEAPGLKLTFSKSKFNWEKHSLSAAVSNLLKGMKKQGSEQPALQGSSGQGVNIMGVSTSMPAVVMDKETRASDDNRPNPWQPYSAETVAKRWYADPENPKNANKHLREQLELDRLQFKTLDLDFQNFTLSTELDKLGSNEGDNYIAVVHADGNGLGLLIQRLKYIYPEPQDNRDYIDEMRNFSENIKTVNRLSQQAMFQQIINSIEWDEHNNVVIYGVDRNNKVNKEQKLQLSKNGNDWVFPFRPLVSGGDDVTFVCDGRIGLDLAVTFLKAFEKYTEKTLNMRLTACAGIAIVKTHYPFARAYSLADDLAGSAKALVNQDKYKHNLENVRYSAIDWHVTAGGLYGDLDAMREREYDVEEGSLTLRPVFVDTSEDTQMGKPHNWKIMRDTIEDFQEHWGEHKNKAEGLREVLRKGSVETAIYKVRYLSQSESEWVKGKPPYLPVIAGFEKNGWQNGYCGYYDALELMDKYIPLKTLE